MAPRRKKELTFDLDGRTVPVLLRRNRQARRIILRVDPKTDGVALTLPWHVSEAEGMGFVGQQEHWIRRRLAALTPRISFEPGNTVTILGEDYVITHAPEAKRGVWIEEDRVHVSGQEEHLSRRLTDWLKKEAKARLAERAEEKARMIDVRVGRITVRDTTSRWGSCAHDGSLNFSWRLIMTPEFVFDFIVAHEVAHIVERNHGPDFHALVDQLTERQEQAEAWLSAYGSALHRIG